MGTYASFDWSKSLVLSEYKTKKKRIILFCAKLSLVKIFDRGGKNVFFEKICDGILCEAAERFEDEARVFFISLVFAMPVMFYIVKYMA